MSKIFVISRHKAVLEWYLEQHKETATMLSHVDLDNIAKGDTVIGNLPLHLIYGICQSGAKYFHICMHVPEAFRGKELSLSQMKDFGVVLEQYYVEKR